MTQSLWLSGSLDSGKKDFQYWLALRRSDPRRYYASSTQREMIEAREALGEEAFYAAIHEQVATFNSDIVAEVQNAIQLNRIVVVGMRYNDSVARACKSLTKAGLDFIYLEYGSYTKGWRRRLALKMWTGWSTFPMIFVDGVLIGGNSDLKKLLAAEAL